MSTIEEAAIALAMWDKRREEERSWEAWCDDKDETDVVKQMEKGESEIGKTTEE